MALWWALGWALWWLFGGPQVGLGECNRFLVLPELWCPERASMTEDFIPFNQQPHLILPVQSDDAISNLLLALDA